MGKLISLAAAAGILALAALPAAAQYPSKPIRFIVPFPPGGGVDVVARTVGEKLGARLGQTIVVDNRPGAGTTLGTSLAAKSAPDGYTLLVGPVIGLAIVHAYYSKLSYDLRRDFAPVSKIGFGTVVMVVPDEARPVDLRFIRNRRADSSYRRAVQTNGRRQHPARAVQGHHAAAARPD